MNWQLYNVILSGTCFMLIFTAFYAASGSAKFVTDSLRVDMTNTTNRTDEIQIGDGYISNSLIYTLNAITNFFAPTIVNVVGHKIAMVSISKYMYLLRYEFYHKMI